MTTRVLIVDDSALVRELLGRLVASGPGLTLVGTAPNGKIALERIDALRPDLVILDIEMPEMDGLEVLRRIRAVKKHVSVLVFSTVTERAGERTLDALALGADDYITKPTSRLGDQGSVERLRDQLLAKIHALLVKTPPASPEERPAEIDAPTAMSVHARPRPEIVAIGASTGGPNALAEILAAFPATFPVPVVIVQHMPPVFTSVFADRLMRESDVRVREARHGDRLEPGTVLIAPGDMHMRVTRRLVELDRGEPENSCRPAVDVLFRSVAATYGVASLGVVLTGMGHDGLAGARALRSVGAAIVVQDRATSTVWSMPRCIEEAGLADAVVPLGSISSEILRRVGSHSPEAGAQR
jgi:two-component system, chemotaxis family, protein-glutamate methylesterase/glutaminase